jgi:hypothetical protein
MDCISSDDGNVVSSTSSSARPQSDRDPQSLYAWRPGERNWYLSFITLNDNDVFCNKITCNTTKIRLLIQMGKVTYQTVQGNYGIIANHRQ